MHSFFFLMISSIVYIAQERQKIFESSNSKPDVALIVSYTYVTNGCNIFFHFV